jgi:hypothetical protein
VRSIQSSRQHCISDLVIGITVAEPKATVMLSVLDINIAIVSRAVITFDCHDHI